MEDKGNSRAKESNVQLHENKAACGISKGMGTGLGVRIRPRVSVNEQGRRRERPRRNSLAAPPKHLPWPPTIRAHHERKAGSIMIPPAAQRTRKRWPRRAASLLA